MAKGTARIGVLTPSVGKNIKKRRGDMHSMIVFCRNGRVVGWYFRLNNCVYSLLVSQLSQQILVNQFTDNTRDGLFLPQTCRSVIYTNPGNYKENQQHECKMGR